VPDAVLTGLARDRAEGSIYFLRSDLRLIDLLRDDLRTLPGWRSRLALLRHHVLPPASYMRQRYPTRPRWPLAALYVARIAGGAPKWLRRLGKQDG
jgi:hypothetical protein